MRADRIEARRRVFVSVVALMMLAVFSASLSAQSVTAGTPTVSSQSPQAPTTFHVNAHLAITDVVVTDRHGMLVHGLTAKDFRVFENGKEQTISSLEEHTGSFGSGPSAGMGALPPDTYSNSMASKQPGPLYVILLDSLNTTMGDQAYAQSELLSLAQSLPKGARVAVFRLGSRLSLLQGFTEDSAQLVETIKSKRASPQLGMFFNDPDLDLAITSPDATSGLGGVGGGKTMSLQDSNDRGAQSDIVVGTTIRSLKELGLYLSQFPGRKNLAWLAGGFPIDILPGTGTKTSDNAGSSGTLDSFGGNRTYTIAIRDLALLLQSADIAVYPIDVRGLVGDGLYGAARPGASGGEAATVKSSSQTVEAFTASNGQIHEIMQTIAGETGGRAYYNTNDIKGSVTEAFNDGSNYYTLSYIPSDQAWDGKFRKTRVHLLRTDAKVYYRDGYYAEEPDKLKHSLPASLSTMQTAMMRGSPTLSDLQFQVHVKAEGGARVIPANEPALKSRGDKSGPHLTGPVVHYALEYTIHANQFQFGSPQPGVYRSDLALSALAFDADGKMLNSVTGVFDRPIRQELYGALQRDALHIKSALDLPTGRVYLRVGVHDLLTGKIGAFEIPLDVTADTLASK